MPFSSQGKLHIFLPSSIEGRYMDPTRPHYTLLHLRCYPFKLPNGWSLFAPRSHRSNKERKQKICRGCQIVRLSGGLKKVRWCYQRDASSSTDTDWGVCSWPWQLFALMIAYRSLVVTSNRCIPSENTWGWSAVVFCACEIRKLFSVLFYVVRTVHKLTWGWL
jgi:hypothetical protein